MKFLVLSSLLVATLLSTPACAQLVNETKVQPSLRRSLAAGAYSCLYGIGCVEMDNPSYFSFPPGDVFQLDGPRPSSCYGEKSTSTCVQRGFSNFIEKTQYNDPGQTGDGNYYNIYRKPVYSCLYGHGCVELESSYFSFPPGDVFFLDGGRPASCYEEKSTQTCIQRGVPGYKFDITYNAPGKTGHGNQYHIWRNRIAKTTADESEACMQHCNPLDGDRKTCMNSWKIAANWRTWQVKCDFHPALTDVTVRATQVYQESLSDTLMSKGPKIEAGPFTSTGLVRLEHKFSADPLNWMKPCFHYYMRGLYRSQQVASTGDGYYVDDNREQRWHKCLRADKNIGPFKEGDNIGACWIGRSNDRTTGVIERMGSPSRDNCVISI